MCGISADSTNFDMWKQWLEVSLTRENAVDLIEEQHYRLLHAKEDWLIAARVCPIPKHRAYLQSLIDLVESGKWRVVGIF
jgi:hypothetical protein